MLAFGPMQIIGVREVISDTYARVVARCCGNGGRLSRDHTSPDDNRTRIAAGKKHEAGRNLNRWGLDQRGKRTSVAQSRSIHQTRREKVRFLHAECLTVDFR